MKLHLFISNRYLFSRRNRNAVNIISAISVLGVATVSFALIVILSVFNGFDGLVKSLFNAFDPDLKITAVQGKVFLPDERFQRIADLPGVEASSHILEENVLLQYADKQYIGILKGVDTTYEAITGIDTMIVEGQFDLQKGDIEYAVIGYGVAYYLSVGMKFLEPLVVWAPKANSRVSMNPEKDFVRSRINVTGIFTIQQEYDSRYVIVPISFSRKLLNQPQKVSAIELKLNTQTPSDSRRLQEQIQAIAGKRFEVKNRYQQQALLNQIMNSEKLAIFVILSFILIIASFNIVGSISMLIIDKKNDIRTLLNMGLPTQKLHRIFITIGLKITGIGVLLGSVLGVLVLLAQIQFGLVKFPAHGFLLAAYPVEMRAADFLWVIFVVMVIGFVASWLPVRKILATSKLHRLLQDL